MKPHDSPVERLVSEAVCQGLPATVTDVGALSAVANILSAANQRQAVSHDRQAA